MLHTTNESHFHISLEVYLSLGCHFLPKKKKISLINEHYCQWTSKQGIAKLNDPSPYMYLARQTFQSHISVRLMPRTSGEHTETHTLEIHKHWGSTHSWSLHGLWRPIYRTHRNPAVLANPRVSELCCAFWWWVQKNDYRNPGPRNDRNLPTHSKYLYFVWLGLVKITVGWLLCLQNGAQS